MLLDRPSTTQSFSDLHAAEDSYSPALTRADRIGSTSAGPTRQATRSTDRAGAISPGDQVVFARLDVAEALGIWRHATGRVVETHEEAQAASEGAVTIDVKFEGHETLHRYLPDLFEKRMN